MKMTYDDAVNILSQEADRVALLSAAYSIVFGSKRSVTLHERPLPATADRLGMGSTYAVDDDFSK